MYQFLAMQEGEDSQLPDINCVPPLNHIHANTGTDSPLCRFFVDSISFALSRNLIRNVDGHSGLLVNNQSLSWLLEIQLLTH